MKAPDKKEIRLWVATWKKSRNSIGRNKAAQIEIL
jgi:hypothetical protein